MLVNILSNETIKVPLTTGKKQLVIEELVDILAANKKIADRETVLSAIMDRERVMSTGVGDGVAIPHGKSEAAPELVAALGISENDIDFDAIDSKPVNLIWLLVGPPSATGPHLKALSRISRLMHNKNFRERMIASRSPDEVISLLRDAEEKIFS